MPRVELRVTAAACFKLVVPLPWLLLVPLLLLGGVPSSITTSCGGSQGEVSLASASSRGRSRSKVVYFLQINLWPKYYISL